jgi:hypothetical protein
MVKIEQDVGIWDDGFSWWYYQISIWT